MLEIISTVATVTQTVITWLDYSRKDKPRTKGNSRSRRTRDTQETAKIKADQVYSDIWYNQHSILAAIVVGSIIWFALFSSLTLFIFGISTAVLTEARAFGLLLIIVAWPMGSLAFAIIIYGILLGLGKVYIGRLVEYYDFKSDSFLYLKILINQTNWNIIFVKWGIQQVLLEVEKERRVTSSR